MNTVNLLSVQMVRRRDRYSLAARALVGKAIGRPVERPLQLGAFSIRAEPSAHVVLAGDSPCVLMKFDLAAVGVQAMLARFDETGDLGRAADYPVEDMTSTGGFGTNALDAVESVFDDEVLQLDTLTDAWEGGVRVPLARGGDHRDARR